MNFKIEGTDEAQKLLTQYQKQLEQKMNRAFERLGALGAYRARIDFTKAMYAGKNDVEITVKQTAHGFELTAAGESVLFVEFGTGVINPEHPLADEAGFHHGIYGKGKGANEKGWVYFGEQGNAGQPLRDGVYRTMGNPPANAMYNASREIRQELMRIIKEEFS